MALIVLMALLVVVRLVIRGTERGLERGSVDFTVRRLVVNLLRFSLLLIVVLLALSIAGVEVGAMLAALGLIGLGIALALQNILENLISGVMILIRKPYDHGEVIITGDVEGFVEDIDLRVTTIRTYDGTLVLVPNADIFASNLTNLSRRGIRRTTLEIGVDYRDDHNAVRDVLLGARAGIEAILPDPEPMVLMVGLGDSSVDFEVRYWTVATLRTVLLTRDEALRACKSALDDAGMTIPWPIRTLAADMYPLQVERTGSGMERVDAPGADESRAIAGDARAGAGEARSVPGQSARTETTQDVDDTS